MSRSHLFQSGNVAVVTGAALGIGRAMSQRFAEMGLSVVMADLPGDDFDGSVANARSATKDPDTVSAVTTDVSDADQIGALHQHVIDRFGKANVLVNNAVTRIGRGFDAEISDWRQVMEVNLWGPITAVDAFLPGLLKSDEGAAIINAGSKQGITNPPGHPIYNMTKSALKTYTEALEHELRGKSENQNAETRVSAHLLVPGWTTTGKAEHKPGAWLPAQVVDMMIEAVSAGDFYIICPDGETSAEMDRKRILWGAGDITENRPPLSRWHPDFAEAAKRACS